jgi:pimeloyl-ACP methyl ester carboxylesterase
MALAFLILSPDSHSNNNSELSTQNTYDMKDSINMEYVTSKDGATIGFRKSGSGPPLLFVHGITADQNSWFKIAPLLEQHFTVYVMDRRGRGGSSDSPNYNLMREAEDVCAVVESIGDSVSVFGHSHGGLCSIEAALLTKKTDKLILYEPALPGIDPVPSGFTDKIRSLVDSNKLEEALILFYRDLVKMTIEEISAMQKSPVWNDRVKSAPTIPRELSLIETGDFDAEKLAELKTSTLLILGGDSPPFARQVIDILNSAIPNSKIVIMTGQQHIAHYTNPELLAEEILKFLLK